MSQLSHNGLERSSCWETIRLVELEELLLAAGGRERRVAHVVLDIERRVVHPQRPAGLKRRRTQPLAVARHEVQPSSDMIEVVVERRRRAIEDQHRTDVHVRRGPFLVQERRVDRGQSVEMLLRHRFSLPHNAVGHLVTHPALCGR